jgi:hypothetical protein
MASMSKIERYLNWSITIAVAVAQIVAYAMPVIIGVLKH